MRAKMSAIPVPLGSDECFGAIRRRRVRSWAVGALLAIAAAAGVLGAGTTAWAQLCGGEPCCGNGICQSIYNECGSCAADCNPAACCARGDGNGVCNANVGENYTNCPQDGCTCGNGICEYPGGNPAETPSSCPADCGVAATCGTAGHTACEAWESWTTCMADCHCGNAACDPYYGETYLNCPADCGTTTAPIMNANVATTSGSVTRPTSDHGFEAKGGGNAVMYMAAGTRIYARYTAEAGGLVGTNPWGATSFIGMTASFDREPMVVPLSASSGGGVSLFFVSGSYVYRYNAATAAQIWNVNKARTVCPQDLLIGPPAVVLYDYLPAPVKTAVQNQYSVRGCGAAGDIVLVATRTACNDMTNNAIIAMAASTGCELWSSNAVVGTTGSGRYEAGPASRGPSIEYTRGLAIIGLDKPYSTAAMPIPNPWSQQTVVAFRIQDGQRLWGLDIGDGVRSVVQTSGRYAYALSYGGFVTAIDMDANQDANGGHPTHPANTRTFALPAAYTQNATGTDVYVDDFALGFGGSIKGLLAIRGNVTRRLYVLQDQVQAGGGSQIVPMYSAPISRSLGENTASGVGGLNGPVVMDSLTGFGYASVGLSPNSYIKQFDVRTGVVGREVAFSGAVPPPGGAWEQSTAAVMDRMLVFQFDAGSGWAREYQTPWVNNYGGGGARASTAELEPEGGGQAGGEDGAPGGADPMLCPGGEPSECFDNCSFMNAPCKTGSCGGGGCFCIALNKAAGTACSTTCAQGTCDSGGNCVIDPATDTCGCNQDTAPSMPQGPPACTGSNTCCPTYHTYPAWKENTAYALYAYVRNAGNVYRATTAGTSGTSGGPTGTGTGIVDGTARWSYMSSEINGGSCKNLASDDTNCGVCGTKCDDGQACTNGACAAAVCVVPPLYNYNANLYGLTDFTFNFRDVGGTLACDAALGIAKGREGTATPTFESAIYRVPYNIAGAAGIQKFNNPGYRSPWGAPETMSKGPVTSVAMTSSGDHVFGVFANWDYSCPTVGTNCTRTGYFNWGTTTGAVAATTHVVGDDWLSTWLNPRFGLDTNQEANNGVRGLAIDRKLEETTGAGRVMRLYMAGWATASGNKVQYMDLSWDGTSKWNPGTATDLFTPIGCSPAASCLVTDVVHGLARTWGGVGFVAAAHTWKNIADYGAQLSIFCSPITNASASCGSFPFSNFRFNLNAYCGPKSSCGVGEAKRILPGNEEAVAIESLAVHRLYGDLILGVRGATGNHYILYWRADDGTFRDIKDVGADFFPVAGSLPPVAPAPTPVNPGYPYGVGYELSLAAINSDVWVGRRYDRMSPDSPNFHLLKMRP